MWLLRGTNSTKQLRTHKPGDICQLASLSTVWKSFRSDIGQSKYNMILVLWGRCLVEIQSSGHFLGRWNKTLCTLNLKEERLLWLTVQVLQSAASWLNLRNSMVGLVEGSCSGCAEQEAEGQGRRSQEEGDATSRPHPQ